MGRNTKTEKKSLCSMFKFFKSSEKPRHKVCDDAEEGRATKMWTSDEDRPGRVADPDINIKASAFIERFHAQTKETK
ncbi:hypothetical protein QJS04_geneDACA004710 [Acorus gramineus]|uniref:Uncharacterized protein n=1 Tax=Acorus gramineus TaxID=55184 RepID=A0AAV9BXU1_ACOGR|nr:hypothetical protein QJS04_geneDACA004710 [Acorus gramineus]